MKLKLVFIALIGVLPIAFFGQQKEESSKQPIENKEKKFNEWGISAGFGVPLIQSGDLTSIKNGAGKNLFGYSAYLSIDKAITHAFGLNLQYDLGETPD